MWAPHYDVTIVYRAVVSAISTLTSIDAHRHLYAATAIAEADADGAGYSLKCCLSSCSCGAFHDVGGRKSHPSERRGKMMNSVAAGVVWCDDAVAASQT